jgi:hypothetical protein
MNVNPNSLELGKIAYKPLETCVIIATNPATDLISAQRKEP